MKKTKHRGQWVLITGASGGIGKEFARVFASQGFNVVLVARTRSKLEALARELGDAYGVEAQVIPVDLSQAGGARQVYDELIRRDIRVEQLVNNAGAGKQSRVVDAEPDTMTGLIELNVTSVTLLCRLIGADMAAAGHGRILNVSSLGAFIPDPYFNVYGPTKAYELFLTLAMAGELKGTGVTVSVLCPGPVKTDWARRAGKADSRLAKDPAEIARIGYAGMQRGRLVIVPTLLYKAERRAMALLPFRVQVGMIRKWQGWLIDQGRRDSVPAKEYDGARGCPEGDAAR